MKILLLRPDSEVYTSTPPLGILSLASYFRDKGGYDVDIYDGRALGASVDDLIRKVGEIRPDVVGISLFAMERIEGHEAAHELKRAFPELTIILGGPYPTTEVLETLQNPSVDFAVTGEGEISGLELLQAIEAGQIPKEIPGVAWRKNGESFIPPIRPFIEELDELPQPAWDLVNLEDYFYNKHKPAPMNLYQKNKESAPIICSRGCPYQCVYCHKLFGKRLRRHSIPYIVEQIEYLHRQKGAREIEIVDDIFNLDVDWTREFAQEITKRNLKLSFSFPNGLRADRMTEEIVDLLVQIGTYRVVYAIETGSPRLQKAIRKNVDLNKARKYIDYSAKKGLSVGAFFMLGFLDETEDEMRQTINFACTNKISTASFFILTPFPGTEVYEQAMARNLEVDKANYTHYYALSANLSQVSDKTITRLRLYAYMRFYLNPFRLIRLFRRTPIPRYFGRTLWTAFLYFVIRPKNVQRRDINEFLNSH